MGLDYPNNHDINAAEELDRWDYRARRYYDMRRLSKTHEVTWSNGSGSTIPDSNLDHVYASDTLQFRQYNRPDGTQADVEVSGWINEATQVARDQWIDDYSDHCILFLEVQRV
jgi:hypothetical protein